MPIAPPVATAAATLHQHRPVALAAMVSIYDDLVTLITYGHCGLAHRVLLPPWRQCSAALQLRKEAVRRAEAQRAFKEASRASRQKKLEEAEKAKELRRIQDREAKTAQLKRLQ